MCERGAHCPYVPLAGGSNWHVFVQAGLFYYHKTRAPEQLASSIWVRVNVYICDENGSYAGFVSKPSPRRVG